MQIANRGDGSLAAGLMACLLACAQVMANVPQTAEADVDDDTRLAQFLARLGLVDLQIDLLERTVRSAAPSPARQQMATRLADLYAQQLMAVADDQAAYARTLQQMESLIRDFPEANSTALQVLLLQADYNRAESLISAWIKDPQEDVARAEAERILSRIAPLLAQHEEALAQQAERLQAELDALPEGDAFQTLDAEVRRVQGVAARAAYFAAWSQYYRGLAAGAPAGADSYAAARDIFRRLLEFGDALPEVTEAPALGLESIWRARALIGLGLSASACGDHVARDRCFELLAAASVPAEISDQAPYWYLRALLQAGQYAQAETYARQRVAQLQPPATQGSVSFCMALVREGFALTGSASANAPRVLGHLGLTGLARLGQLGVLQALLDKFPVALEGDTGFVLAWAAGQRQFAAAETSKEPEDYRAAAQHLRAALAAPEAKSLLGPASRCRYALAWCHFRLGEYEPAAREFTEALTGLTASGDESAAESAWMAFAAYRRLADADPRWQVQATAALDRIAQDFPHHPYARRAELERTRWLEHSDPQAAARQLEAIPEGDEHYLRARYDLCRLRHRLWSEQRQDPTAGSARLAELREAVATLLRAAPRTLDPASTLSACLLLADAALHHTPPQPDVAAQILEQAEVWAGPLPVTDPAVIEYHYRLLELATVRENAVERQREAEWLASHATGSPYELPALLIVANALDRTARQLQAANDSERRAAEEQAYTAFQRVVTLLEQKAPALAQPASRNLQTAYSRLAHYATQRGQHAESAELLERLLAAQPADSAYLRRAGLARAAAGQYAQSLDHWRTLLLGLAKGTDPWYEAKYFQLQALGRTDRAQARKVLRQFQLLYPELGGDTWRDKFLELQRSWE